MESGSLDQASPITDPLAMRRRSRWLLALALVTAVLIAVGIWSSQLPPGEKAELQAAISSAAAGVGDGGFLQLKDVATFEWDRVYAFQSYSGVSDVHEALGFDWSPLSPFNNLVFGDLFLGYDEMALLVFVRGDQDVTGWAILNGPDLGDSFIGLRLRSQNQQFSRDGAVFGVSDAASDPLTGIRGWLLTPS